MATAGYALESCTESAHAAEQQTVIEFIQTLTARGMQLPVDTQVVLEKLISNGGVLEIFANVSKNKQIIQLNLLNAMINMFDPTQASANDAKILLIGIFENAVKINQPLPAHLLYKLEKALHNKELEQSVLPTFIYLAQKGTKLPRHVIDKLLARIFTQQDPVLKQELLSSLGSLIDANQTEINVFLTKINHFLTKEIKSDHFNIQRLCIMVIHKLVTVCKQLDDELLNALVEIGISLNCNKTVRNDISVLFESIEADSSDFIHKNCYREKLKLANLNANSTKDLLDQLKLYANLEDGLLEQNYKQLMDVIDNMEARNNGKKL